MYNSSKPLYLSSQEYIEDSDELWMVHYRREFKTKKQVDGLSWRDSYLVNIRKILANIASCTFYFQSRLVDSDKRTKQSERSPLSVGPRNIHSRFAQRQPPTVTRIPRLSGLFSQ